jgi:RP/EB family microtubule-associated protein
VSLNKVNWRAKNDYEFINNFKILQNSFDKLGIKRHVDVSNLSM